MARKILQLILVSIVLTSQLSFGLANAENSGEDIAGQSSSSGRESVKDASAEPDSAKAQYLLGVIEYNEGNVELAKVWFKRAWEFLETEKSKAEVVSPRLRGALSDKSLISASPAKVQFPKGYKINVYYRDGWYTQPKSPSFGKKQVYSFLPGSTYKIRVEAEKEQPEHKRISIGTKVIAGLVMASWLIAR